MLTDLLCTDNYAMFNTKVASVMGLHAAVYINELLNITQKATQKRKVTEGFVTLNRDYISGRTTLEVAEQLAIDKKLAGVGVLELKSDFPDQIKLNVDTLANLVAADEAALLKKVTKLTTVKTASTSSIKGSARQRTIAELKDYINCSNAELLAAYHEWVDGVYAKPGGFLSKKAITVFQRELDEFTQGDLDLALKILEIATINGYRCAEWAINLFNKDYAKDFYAKYVTETSSAPVRNVLLSSEVF